MTSLNDKKSLKIVAVFAHPDDEASIIGTLANHSKRGDKVYGIFLTQGENASSLCCSPDEIKTIRAGHARKIEKIIGAEYRILDLPDSAVFPSVENGKKVAMHFKEIKPDIIITWSRSEQLGLGHPDHRYTHQIVLDATSYARYKNPDCPYEPHRTPMSLFTTYSPIDNNLDKPFFVDVSEQYETIMAVLDVYREAYGQWPVKNFIEAQLVTFGRMAGVKYAEAFTKILWRTAQPYLF
ncbi:MAG: PIG-L family deacetylase [Asgard group archaeon]|nr:PIG-L family deacetylase [Asgard group archaeon]